MLTEAQHALRRTGIGASEIAALAGLSRWATPIRIWEAKMGGPPLETSVAMELGNLLEEPIAALYRARRSCLTVPVGTLRHPDLPLALATPDRAVFDAEHAPRDGTGATMEDRGEVSMCDRLLQIKSTTWRMAGEWGAPGTDEVPEDYLAQVTWEMGVAGVEACDLAVLFDKDRLEVYSLRYSPELFGALYEVAARFWRDYVEPKRAPPPDASDAYAEWLGRAYPSEKSKALAPLPEELAGDLRRYAFLKVVERGMKGALKEHRNRICAAIGLGGGFSSEWGKATWSKARDSVGTDWEAVAREGMRMAREALEHEPMDAAQRARALRAVDGLVSAHPKVKTGGRRFLVTPSPAALGAMPEALRLNELTAGEESAEE